MPPRSKLWPLSLSAALVVALSVSIVSAAPWSGPTQAPPAGNTPAPINVGSNTQVKIGGISAENFGSVSGYCIGASCISAWPTSQWTLAGTDLYYTAGKVGIGTTTPGTRFSIQGVANLHTATSTFYSTGGINIKNGCFAVNGVCISGGSGSGAVTIQCSLFQDPSYGFISVCINLSTGRKCSLNLETAETTREWVCSTSSEWPWASANPANIQCTNIQYGYPGFICTNTATGEICVWNELEPDNTWSCTTSSGWSP